MPQRSWCVGDGRDAPGLGPYEGLVLLASPGASWTLFMHTHREKCILPVPHLFTTVLSVTLNLLIIHRKSVVPLAVFFICWGLHVLFIDQKVSRSIILFHSGSTKQGAVTSTICEGGNKSQRRKTKIHDRGQHSSELHQPPSIS